MFDLHFSPEAFVDIPPLTGKGLLNNAFDLHFSPEAFVDILPLLGKGLLGVFVVICAIWALVALLNKIAK